MKILEVCLVLVVAFGFECRASVVMQNGVPMDSLVAHANPVDMHGIGIEARLDLEVDPDPDLTKAAKSAGILAVPEQTLITSAEVDSPQPLRMPGTANAFARSVETGLDLVAAFIYTLGAWSLVWVGFLMLPR
ncbi:MAG: hypothetical protein HY820_20650 [Acidobacteria bacterium]|nr:hypothetical protein [Acidobacteriota bacterium]